MFSFKMTGRALIFMIFAASICGMISWIVAQRAVAVLERQTLADVSSSLSAAGQEWTSVSADGLLLRLSGTAPSEGSRFRALEVTGQAVGTDRIIDETEVVSNTAESMPDFAVEIMRIGNDVSLIGLMPSRDARVIILNRVADIHEDGTLTDLLEAVDYDPPDGWNDAIGFALDQLDWMSRGQTKIVPGSIEIKAYLDGTETAEAVEERLRSALPDGLNLALQLTPPKPVRSPFRFAAQAQNGDLTVTECHMNSELALDQVGDEISKASMENCIVAIGAPSPRWSDAVLTAASAARELENAEITISDADVRLIGPASMDGPQFRSVAEKLRSNLPEIFSLSAIQPEPENSDDDTVEPPPVFTAVLDPETGVTLEGALRDPMAQEAVRTFAAARFGSERVTADFSDASQVSSGWTAQVMSGLDGLATLHQGRLRIEDTRVALEGIAIREEAQDQAMTALSTRFDAQNITLDAVFDSELQRVEKAPDAQVCENQLAALMETNEIAFAPNSADISNESEQLLDEIADVIMSCANATFEIGGHTDSQGREEMNLGLSQARADSVLDSLLLRNVLLDHMIAKGFGETRPIADNGTEEGRSRNRRIEFRLLNRAEFLDADDTASSAEQIEPEAGNE